MEKYLDRFEPNVGDTWRADEVYVKFKDNMKYLFALMNDETRFWIAQQVADKEGVSDTAPMLHKSKPVAHKLPKTFITDGAPNFHRAYKDEFYQTYLATDKRRKPFHTREI